MPIYHYKKSIEINIFDIITYKDEIMYIKAAKLCGLIKIVNKSIIILVRLTHMAEI